MKNLMSVLKLAVDKEYPIYSAYLHSTGDRLQTCSRDNIVDLEEKMPWKGCVKFSVLDSICKLSDEIDFQIEDDYLLVSYGDATAKLNIDDVGFPEIPDIVADFIDLDEETVSAIKTAIKFTGKGLYSYVYMNSEAIMASDKARIFFHQFSGVGVDDYIAINKDVARLLDPSYKLGVNFKDGHTVVDVGKGKVRFSMDNLADYPSKNIWEFVDLSAAGGIGICMSEDLLSAVKKVTPVLVDDNEPVVQLKNTEDGLLEVSALSNDVGSSAIYVSSKSDEKLTLNIGVNTLMSLESGYEVAFCKNDSGEVNRLYALKDKNEVILMGFTE